MGRPKLTKLELQVLEALWQKGACSVREIQETFPGPGRPAYTTVQTVVYRLERKQALRCVKRISNANIFEALVSRKAAERRLVDELLGLFGGRAKLVMAHLVESGELTLADVREADRYCGKSSRARTNPNDFCRTIVARWPTTFGNRLFAPVSLGC